MTTNTRIAPLPAHTLRAVIPTTDRKGAIKHGTGKSHWLPLAVLALVLAVTQSATGASFANATAMTTPRLYHTATLLQNGKVLVVAGVGNTWLSSAELYDPTTGTWVVTGSLPAARYDHTATLLPNGKVLVVGGLVGEHDRLSSALLYDPATGTWAATGSLSIARNRHTATLLPNGQVLVTGGEVYNGPKLSSAELYNPATGTWTATGSLSIARNRHTATLLPNGKVLVAGGEVYNSAELYDPASGTWATTGSMTAARSDHAVVLLPNGKVLAVMGNFNANAELYDPATGAWTVTGALSTGRINGTATLLPGGKVLVAGGYNVAVNSALSSAELFNPATGLWEACSPLNNARHSHVAVLLPTGEVLLAAGNANNPDSSYLASAELFDPSPYALTLSPVVNGQIIGDAGQYLLNTTATLTATASPGYAFAAWTGDVTGTANPLGVLMNCDKTVGANFIPDTNDDDDDGLTNYQECVVYGTNPTKQDTDNDGVKDKADAFPLDPAETLDTDHDGIGDNADLDDDGDGLSDADEINIHHTNPKLADSDGDGLSDPDELQVHLTNPNLADSDNDGLNDGAEISHGTKPTVPDTDGDGYLDGYEVLTGHLPLDIADHPALVAEARTAIEFTFPAALGKTYRIEDSLDLTTWATVETGIAGNGEVIQRFYTTRGMPQRYFRVEEIAP